MNSSVFTLLSFLGLKCGPSEKTRDVVGSYQSKLVGFTRLQLENYTSRDI